MTLRKSLILAVMASIGSSLPLLTVPTGAASANQDSAADSEPAFNNTKTPLSSFELQLLAQDGYRLQSDEKIAAPDNSGPISASEAPQILEELAGKQRLKAMLELDIIFNEHGYTNLPPDILGKVRHTARDNWAVLPERVRKDLRPYFAIEELDAMQKTIPPVQTPLMWLPKQAEIASETAASSLTPPGMKPPAPATLNIPVAVVPVLPPSAAIPPPRPSTTIAPAAGTFKVTAPAEQPRWQAAAAPSTATASAETSKSSVSSSTPVASSPAAAAAPAPLPAYLEVTPAVFEQFLVEAPYDHEVKGILKIISEHAPAEYRRTALGIVMRYLPQILISSGRAGTHLEAYRVQLHGDIQRPGGYSIALNPGPVLLKKGNFMTGSEYFLLPGATDYYRELNVAVPNLKASNDGSVSERETQTAWGKARQYSDGSLMLHYSPEQMAGSLLKELLNLDAHMRGWDTDPYHLALRTESAQFMFYYKMRQDTGKPPALIPGLQAKFNEWLERPEDYVDFIAQSLAAPSCGIAVPSLAGTPQERQYQLKRHDLALLQQSGSTDKAEIKKALAQIPAAPVPNAVSGTNKTDGSLIQELNALDNPSFIRDVWLSEEQQFLEQLHEKK